MKKIIDNFVISAIGRNITSVELMPIIQSRYQVVVPEDVVLECKRFEDGRLIPLIESEFPTCAVFQADFPVSDWIWPTFISNYHIKNFTR